MRSRRAESSRRSKLRVQQQGLGSVIGIANGVDAFARFMSGRVLQAVRLYVKVKQTTPGQPPDCCGACSARLGLQPHVAEGLPLGLAELIIGINGDARQLRALFFVQPAQALADAFRALAIVSIGRIVRRAGAA